MGAPDFWDHPEKAQQLMRETTALKDTCETYRKLESRYEDMQVLWELGMEEKDESHSPRPEYAHGLLVCGGMFDMPVVEGGYNTPDLHQPIDG